ncbi:unnamed protein product [Symbiodinium sp. CCMP2592]|nr:unnamed protein product [Symbiodinium sp. CCMP2592]
MSAGAATAAAAAAQAAQAVLETSESYRRSDVLRTLIQKPDVFRPDTREQEVEQWSEWKHMIKNYLSVVDTKMLEDMETIEKSPTRPSTVDGMDAAVRKRSIELYAILLSFVRQRPAKLVRGVPSNNGFEAWRVLVGEMQPATRQRQLALMSQLAGIRFDANRSLAEQIVKYEELIKEYERVSGSTYPDDLRISSVIQAAPTNLQTQLHLTMDESTDYKAIREKLLAYERASTRWQPSSGFALPAVNTHGALNQSGPTDMEIDRVEKGKGGHKGGKQGGHKGKKGEKGKGKGKEKGGKGKKGSKGGPPGGCYNCGGRHFVRDCPKGKGKGKNQVNQEQPTAAPPPPSSTAPTTPAPTTTRPTTTSQPPANSVRRVRLVTPPDANTTYVFDISDNDVVADFYDDFPEEPAVRAVSVRSPPSGGTDQEQDPVTIVLDHWTPGQMRAWLTDAQGNDIPTEALRRYAFELRDHRGQSFIIKETCVVGRVRVPLLAAGKLLKQGWQLVSEEDPGSTGGAGPRSMILRSPAGLRAPVAFKHNSLVVQGEVRAITEIPRSLPPKVPKVTISAEMEAMVGNEGMHVLGNGIKMHYQAAATDLLDPRPWYDAITLIGMDAFEEGFFPEGGVAPKPSELVVESHPRPQENQQNDPQNAKENQQNDPQNAKENQQNDPMAQATTWTQANQDYVAANAAQAVEGIDRRDPVPRGQPEGAPDDAAVALHNLMHMPFASWCEACVRTRSRGDRHSQGANREVRLPILQVDFYFASLEEGGERPNPEGEQENCILIGVDLDTKMVLAVPGPNKGAVILAKATEEIVRFTLALHQEQAVIVQSDGEPAIKAVVRAVAAARARLGRKTVQRTTPVAAHESNGAAERTVQTIRRLVGACMLLGFELQKGKLAPDTPLKMWSQVHAAFVRNRFHVIPGLQQTPFEIAFGGKRFDQKLCEFGDTVYGQVFRTNKAEPRWVKAIWVGMNPHSGANNLMTVYGHIQSASVRRAAPDQQLTADQIKEGGYIGWPWNKDFVEKPARRKKRETRTAEAAPRLEPGVSLPLGAPAGHPLLPEEDSEAEQVEKAARNRADGGSSEELLPATPPRSPTTPATPPDLQSPTEAAASGKRKAEEAEPFTPYSPSFPSWMASSGEQQASPPKRMVETVDAEWAEHGPEIEAEIAADTQESAEDPPNLSDDELAVLDDAAELEEIERLEKMTVLVDPVAGEEAEHLSTVFVKTWKYDKARGWFRRARVVARQYKWSVEMAEEDTFSPAWVTTLARMVPLLAQQWNTPVWVMDIKDAFLQVKQPADEPVLVTSPRSYTAKFGQARQWKLGRVLPGQRKGSLSGDVAEDLESMEEVPTLFRARAGNYAAQIHVDDITSTGAPEIQEKIQKTLESKYQVKVNGPFHSPGDMYEFLRRRHQFEPDGSITIRAATRFYQDLYELAGRPKKRSTPGPSGKEDMFDLDNTKALESGEATLYRTMLGKLLYMSAERPDCQAAIQYLSGKASAPTERAAKLLRHLVGYMWENQGYGVKLKLHPGRSVMQLTGDHQGGPGGEEHEHLIEGFSDSNFANDRTTRRSLSSGQIFIGQALAYSFVRGQKVVTLSSGEAELVALTQTTSECILVKKAWEFLVQQEATLTMRSDSSVARAIASRLGVGRVRHLQTSCLWIQQWVAQHLLKVLAVPTEFNPADLGTKCFTARRLRLLCYLVGLVHDNGEHVGQNEFREATARRAGQGDRNNDVVVRLVQLLAAVTLQGCEFGPAGPGELFDDLASLIYVVILVSVRYFWFVGLLAVAWWLGRRSSGQPAQEAPQQKGRGKGKRANRRTANKMSQEATADEDQEATTHENQEATTDGDQSEITNEEAIYHGSLEGINFEEPGEPTGSTATAGLGLEPAAGNSPAALDPEVAQRIQDWMVENALPMLGVEARPSGATTSGASSSSTTPMPLPVPSTSGRSSNHKIEQARERGKFLRDAKHFLPEQELAEFVFIASHGYAYHREGCGDLRCARRTTRMTVRRAIQAGKVPCKHCFQEHWEYSRGQR